MCIALWAGPLLYGQSLELEGNYTGSNAVSYAVELLGADIEEIIQQTSRNKQYRISYEVRLYRKADYIGLFWGDQVIASREYRFLFSKDAVSGLYEISDDSNQYFYSNRQELERIITRVSGSFDLTSQTEDTSKLYLRARCTLSPDILEPPLRILEFFLGRQNTYVGWVTFSIGPNQK